MPGIDLIYLICKLLSHQPWEFAELPDPFADGEVNLP